jgi:hypothetical protein
MIECLEDADGQVRESAKTNIIELFRYVRSRLIVVSILMPDAVLRVMLPRPISRNS